MTKRHTPKYKVLEHFPVPKNKRGYIDRLNPDFGKYENKTVDFLADCGIDVTILAPSNVPRSKNPDLNMLGTVWEIKTFLTANTNTVKTHFRKAIKQSGGKAVFDLRFYKYNPKPIEKAIIDLFQTSREMHRIMLIVKNREKTEKILDFIK